MKTRFQSEKKKIIVIVLCFMLTLSMSGRAQAATDISGHWAEAAIQSWIDKGYISGYPDGTLRPDQPISRAEFMALANNSLGYTVAAALSYSDVNTAAWYYQTVAVAQAAGYIGGYPDGTMKPDQPISREEAAAMLMKIGRLQANPGGTDIFSDAARMAWSKGAIGAIAAAKIMAGYPDKSFRPQDRIKRGEAVVSLQNLLDRVISEYRADGNQLTVILNENPSTGYSWSYQMDQGGIVELVSDGFVSGATDSNMVGAGGKHQWMFRSLAAGKVEIAFHYFRPWEDISTAIEVKAIIVNVDKDGNILISFPPAPSQTAVIYQNTQYGFSFTLPESWRGYTIVSGQWEGRALEGTDSGMVVETGPILSIRHPEWTSDIPRQDIPIMIFTPDQWAQVQQEALSLGAAPIGPRMIGANAQYIFAIPARYNYAFPVGFEEVEEILNNDPLQVLTVTP